MDGSRFDAFAKSVAATSRRRALQLAIGGGTAAALARFGVATTFAQVTPAATDLICQSEPLLCNRNGQPAGRCNSDGCRCARAINGDQKCVRVGNASCNNQQRCERNKDCPSGSVCIDIDGCEDCGGRKPGRCFQRCTA